MKTILIASRRPSIIPQPLPSSIVLMNEGYMHLMQKTYQQGIKMYATNHQYFSSDEVNHLWHVEGDEWKLTEEPIDFDLIYGKFPHYYDPQAKIGRDYVQQQGLELYPDPDFSDLLTDKQASYSVCPEHTPYTITVGADLEQAVEQLYEQSLHEDLDPNRMVLKPRYGHEGFGVYCIHRRDWEKYREVVENKDYILQPFLETKHGIPAINIRSRHDMRLSVFNGKVSGFYVRMPKNDGFLSNISQGGGTRYGYAYELPPSILTFAQKVDQQFTHLGPRYYSLDVGVGRSGKVWIYELNDIPFFTWVGNSPSGMAHQKRLHGFMVRFFKTLLAESSST
ncbi:MAG: ATP-grasp domain-containing protein [Flammeovirgaceae bacterium]